MTEITLKTNRDQTAEHEFEAGDWFFDRTTETLYCLVSRWDEAHAYYVWGLINIVEGRLYAYNQATSPLDAFAGDFRDFDYIKKAAVSIEF